MNTYISMWGCLWICWGIRLKWNQMSVYKCEMCVGCFHVCLFQCVFMRYVCILNWICFVFFLNLVIFYPLKYIIWNKVWSSALLKYFTRNVKFTSSNRFKKNFHLIVMVIWIFNTVTLHTAVIHHHNDLPELNKSDLHSLTFRQQKVKAC